MLLASILLYAVSILFSNAIKTSAKGSAHLTNVQSTSLLLSQMEADFQRACDISGISTGDEDVAAKFSIIEDGDTGGKVTSSVTYERGPQDLGMVRTWDSGSGARSHPYCRDLKMLACGFRRVDLLQGRIGVLIHLKAGTPPDGTEPFEIKRFILCRNHASNTSALGWEGL